MFQRVHLQKKDAEGNIKTYYQKDKEGRYVLDETGNYKTFNTLSYIEDLKTGDLYLDESWDIVAVKCAAIALLVNPFYTLGKLSFYICKTPIEMTVITLDIIAKVGQQFAMCKFYEGCIEIRNGCSQLFDIAGDGLFEIVKIPIFSLSVELAAIYGMVKPYHGREFEALIEKAWQRGASYKDDFRNIPARTGENCWQAFINDMQLAHPFYLAHCFQVRGNTHNPRIVVLRREPT